MKKIIVLFSLGFILFGFNFVFASEAPVINPTGGIGPISVIVGSEFTDPGATATDDVDSGIIIVNSVSTVNTNEIGNYTITYSAEDSEGNKSTLIREVNVISLSNLSISKPANKLIYNVGDSLDISGLEITGIYNDESTKIETIKNSDITGFDSSIPAEDQALVITVGSKTATYTIDIVIPKENFIIRDGDNLIWQGQIDLPAVGQVEINKHNIDSRSVLGILYKLDQNNDLFEISDLPFSDVYGSFYLKCLTPQGSSVLCDNWKYSVGAISPGTGIDTTILSGGETVGIFFGTSHRVVLDKNNITAGDTLSAISEKYNYETNIWSPLSGISIGVTLPNPDPKKWWDPIIVSSHSVDLNGVANIKISEPNTYNLGIVEDYYMPSYSVIVSDVVSSGGGSSAPSQKSFSISDAVSFLLSQQQSDGSFGSPMYTDWAAVALASGGNYNSKLINYLKSNSVDSDVATDYERRAMALMSLDINPYTGTGVNYIKKITDSFDGIQFGDASLVNDDIFALIVLKNAGYNESDEIITKDINFIISKQSGSSWGSIDMTSAAIQALRGFESIPNVSASISKAENYLIENQGDGSFGNSFSSSWALQSMPNSLSKAENYLASKQQTDGGLENITDDINSRVWATSYAIPAVLHKSWDDILKPFGKMLEKKSSPSVSDVEKNNETPIVAIPKIEEVKKEEIKDIEGEKGTEGVLVASNLVKNTKTEKPILKGSQKENIKESSINLSTQESLSEIRQNIFSRIGSVITLEIKAFFSWLLVNLGFWYNN